MIAGVVLQYNLQFFAKDGPGGEKTEEPTSKKLTDARSEGQVAKSREVVNAAMLLGLFLLMKFWVGNIGVSFISFFRPVSTFICIPTENIFICGAIFARIPSTQFNRSMTQNIGRQIRKRGERSFA